MATLDVQRVWKGKVGQRITVYFVGSLYGPTFDTDSRVIVFAQPHTPDCGRWPTYHLKARTEVIGCRRVKAWLSRARAPTN